MIDGNEIDGAFEIAKNMLIRDEYHGPMALIFDEKEKRIGIANFPYHDDEEKEHMRLQVKEQILKNHIKKYVTIFTAWCSTYKDNKIYRRPSRDIDRREVLMVTLFTPEKVYDKSQFFKTVNDKIIFEEEIDLSSSNNIWNFFSDDKKFQEEEKAFKDKLNDDFYKNLSKEVYAKFKDELNKAKTIDEKKLIYQKMLKEGVLKLKEQNKTILEDVQEDEV